MRSEGDEDQHTPDNHPRAQYVPPTKALSQEARRNDHIGNDAYASHRCHDRGGGVDVAVRGEVARLAPDDQHDPDPPNGHVEDGLLGLA